MYGYLYNGSFSPPYTADQVSGYNGAYNPSGVKLDSFTKAYFTRDLFQRLSNFIEWHNLPETWLKDYVNFALMFCGFCGVIDGGEKYGVVPQWGTLSGWGIYQEPNVFNVVTSYFQKTNMVIGEDCELLRLTPDFRGFWDVVEFFAVKLALVSRDFDMSAISSTISVAVAAKTRAAAQTIKAMFDKAQAGEPLVVFDNALLLENDGENEKPWQEFTRDVHDSLILEETLDAIERLYKMFDAAMGIPYADTEQERTLKLQAMQTAGGAQSRITQMIETLERSCERVNKMYGLNIHATLRGGESNAPDNNAE